MTIHTYINTEYQYYFCITTNCTVFVFRICTLFEKSREIQKIEIPKLPDHDRRSPEQLLFRKNLNASKPSEHPPQVEECLKVVVSHIQRIGCQPEKTTLHGGQSRSWSAEQGKENKRKSLAAYPHPPTPHTACSEKINKITRRIYRRYAGGRSRVRTRIPSARRLGLWVWLRKILHSRLR